MVKREDVYAEALGLKRMALEKQTSHRNLLLDAAYKSTPRLAEIDRELASLGAQIAITALSGDMAQLQSLQEAITALSNEKKALFSTMKIPEITYECPLCQDSGYVKGKLCECVKTLAKQITFNRLQQQMPINECKFSAFDLSYYSNQPDENNIVPLKKMTTVFKFCREYALNFNPDSSQSLLFLGNTGLGKTHLTLAIVSEAIEKGYNVIYGSAYNLLSAVEKEHFSSGTQEDSYSTMLESDLLVIDDLGTEFTSPFTLSVLYNLINSRLLSKKPTIINSNLTLSELEKRYTPRIASRIIGNYAVHKFFGNDVRQLKAIRAKRP